MNSLEDIWSAAYTRLASMFTDVIVDTWLSGLIPIELRGDTLVIEAPSNFVKEIVEARYHSMIVECVEAVTGFKTYVSIRSAEDPSAPLVQESTAFAPRRPMNRRGIWQLRDILLTIYCGQFQ
jgi:chromosomal replication initiator protein